MGQPRSTLRYNTLTSGDEERLVQRIVELAKDYGRYGSCVRHRPEYKDHVWSYDFVINRSDDGRPMKMLTIIDEYTRECLLL